MNVAIRIARPCSSGKPISKLMDFMQPNGNKKMIHGRIPGSTAASHSAARIFDPYF